MDKDHFPNKILYKSEIENLEVCDASCKRLLEVIITHFFTQTNTKYIYYSHKVNRTKRKKPYDSYMLRPENFIQEKSYLNLILNLSLVKSDMF